MHRKFCLSPKKDLELSGRMSYPFTLSMGIERLNIIFL